MILDAATSMVHKSLLVKICCNRETDRNIIMREKQVDILTKMEFRGWSSTSLVGIK